MPTTYGVRADAPAQLDATGSGKALIQNNNSAALWIVRQISLITAPVTSGTTCTVRPPTGIVDTSYFAGTGDVAGGDPPIYLRSGEYIELEWENGPANGTGVCTYFYDEVIL